MSMRFGLGTSLVLALILAHDGRTRRGGRLWSCSRGISCGDLSRHSLLFALSLFTPRFSALHVLLHRYYFHFQTLWLTLFFIVSCISFSLILGLVLSFTYPDNCYDLTAFSSFLGLMLSVSHSQRYC